MSFTSFYGSFEADHNKIAAYMRRYADLEIFSFSSILVEVAISDCKCL